MEGRPGLSQSDETPRKLTSRRPVRLQSQNARRSRSAYRRWPSWASWACPLIVLPHLDKQFMRGNSAQGCVRLETALHILRNANLQRFFRTLIRFGLFPISGLTRVGRYLRPVHVATLACMPVIRQCMFAWKHARGKSVRCVLGKPFRGCCLLPMRNQSARLSALPQHSVAAWRQVLTHPERRNTTFSYFHQLRSQAQRPPADAASIGLLTPCIAPLLALCWPA
jgi:hypothetical protein